MRCRREQRNKQNPLDLISVITEMVESGSGAQIQQNRWMDELEEKQMIKSNFNRGGSLGWHLLILDAIVKQVFYQLG